MLISPADITRGRAMHSSYRNYITSAVPGRDANSRLRVARAIAKCSFLAARAISYAQEMPPERDESDDTGRCHARENLGLFTSARL